MRNTNGLTPTQLEIAGKVARQLLDTALKGEYFWDLMKNSLHLVCRTFQTDPIESAKLLRLWLDPNRLNINLIREMGWVVKEIKWVIPFDPDLVKEIYCAAYTHKEKAVMLGGARIYRSSINSQVVFENTLRDYDRRFHYFFEHAPIQATQSLIVAVEAFRYETLSEDSLETDSFIFNAKTVIIKSDYSSSWDSNDLKPSQELDPTKRLLNAFEENFYKLSEQNNKEFCQKVINTICIHNTLAVLWRRLIICGIKAPKTIGQEIRALTWTETILLNQDTTKIIGEFIKTIFPFLDKDERELVEKTILKLPNSKIELKEEKNYTRNRLFNYLMPELLVTQEAKKLFNQMSINENEVSESEFTDTNNVNIIYDKRPILVEPIDTIPEEIDSIIAQVDSLIFKVDSFSWKYLGPVPDLIEIENLFPTLHFLYEYYKSSDLSVIKTKHRIIAWNSIVKACQRAAKANNLSCKTFEGKFIKNILLEASNDYQNEDTSWWFPRSHAALGLTQLSRIASCSEDIIFKTIERLSFDTSIPVRAQVANYLHCMSQTSPNLMWKIIHRMCKEEVSIDTLDKLIYGPIDYLALIDPYKTVENLQLILDTFSKKDKFFQDYRIKEAVNHCGRIIFEIYFKIREPLLNQHILTLLQQPTKYLQSIKHFIDNIGWKDLLIYEHPELTMQEENEIREMAFDLLNQLLKSIAIPLCELESKIYFQKNVTLSEDEHKLYYCFREVADTIVDVFYSTSGALSSESILPTFPGEKNKVMSKTEKMRFIQESDFLMTNLASLGIPYVTHHLLKVMNYFMNLDPEKIFIKVREIVQLGKIGKYEYEQGAADYVVRLIRSFITEYRSLIMQSKNCREAILEILNTFVQVGWKEAIKLTHSFENYTR